MSSEQIGRRRYADIAVTYTADEFQGIYRGKRQHDEDFDDVVARAQAVGCHKIVLTTMTLAGARTNLEVCKRFPGQCYMTVGVHPYHSADLYDGTSPTEELATFSNSVMADHPNTIVAFGEIGLDYFYLDRARKELQKKAFVDQLNITSKFDLPLFLHVRDSYEDFVTLIKPYLPELPKKGIVHSFAGTKDEMLGLVALGFDISVNGVSFKTEEQLEMVRAIPMDRLQIETDAPWCEIPTTGPAAEFLKDAPPLLPSRKRDKFIKGQMVKGRNESCTIERVAHVVARVKGVPMQEVVDVAWLNSVRMFGIGEQIE